MFVDRPLGHALQVQVERGRDLQAAAVDPGAAVFLEQSGTGPFDEVLGGGGARDAGLARLLLLGDAAARLRLQPSGLVRGDVAVLRHLIERVVASELVVVLALDRVVQARGVQHGGEHGRLAHRELARALVEVGLRRRLRPVGAVAEVHGVQVLREDLVLRELLLDLDREQGLADLLLDRAGRHDVLLHAVRVLDVLARVDVLHELLGDRRGADHGLALHEVGPRGADDAAHVDAGMLVEPGVLGGEHGVLEVVRDLLQPDDLAVDRAVQRRQLGAVAIEEVARADRGQRVGKLDAGVRDVERAEQRRGHEHGHEQEHPPEPTEETLLPCAGGVFGDVLGRFGPRGDFCRHGFLSYPQGAPRWLCGLFDV